MCQINKNANLKANVCKGYIPIVNGLCLAEWLAEVYKMEKQEQGRVKNWESQTVEHTRVRAIIGFEGEFNRERVRALRKDRRGYVSRVQ